MALRVMTGCHGGLLRYSGRGGALEPLPGTLDIAQRYAGLAPVARGSPTCRGGEMAEPRNLHTSGSYAGPLRADDEICRARGAARPRSLARRLTVKMAHSGRWRFPARPGSGGWGRRGLGGSRLRVPAVRSLRAAEPAAPEAAGDGERGGPCSGGGAAGSGGGGAAPGSGGSGGPAAGVGPGFDAALQVSAAIGINLRRFRAACGAEAGSGEVRRGGGAGGREGKREEGAARRGPERGSRPASIPAPPRRAAHPLPAQPRPAPPDTPTAPLRTKGAPRRRVPAGGGGGGGGGGRRGSSARRAGVGRPPPPPRRAVPPRARDLPPVCPPRRRLHYPPPAAPSSGRAARGGSRRRVRSALPGTGREGRREGGTAGSSCASPPRSDARRCSGRRSLGIAGGRH